MISPEWIRAALEIATFAGTTGGAAFTWGATRVAKRREEAAQERLTLIRGIVTEVIHNELAGIQLWANARFVHKPGSDFTTAGE